jgi:hypothetical protein
VLAEVLRQVTLKRWTRVALLLFAFAPCAAAQMRSPCAFTLKEFAPLTAEATSRLYYEGTFPETTEGAHCMVYLRADGTPVAALIGYMGETGRSDAFFLYEDGEVRSIGWARHSYGLPIYMDSGGEHVRTVRTCFVRQGDGFEAYLGEEDADFAVGLMEDLELFEREHLKPYSGEHPHLP